MVSIEYRVGGFFFVFSLLTIVEVEKTKTSSNKIFFLLHIYGPWSRKRRKPNNIINNLENSRGRRKKWSEIIIFRYEQGWGRNFGKKLEIFYETISYQNLLILDHLQRNLQSVIKKKKNYTRFLINFTNNYFFPTLHQLSPDFDCNQTKKSLFCVLFLVFVLRSKESKVTNEDL